MFISNPGPNKYKNKPSKNCLTTIKNDSFIFLAHWIKMQELQRGLEPKFLW